MTTPSTMVEEFDRTHRDAVLLQLQEELSPADALAASLARNSPDFGLSSEYPGYAPTLYKGGSDQWFVTYELGPDSSEEGSCPQVTRVYISGELRGWEVGTFPTRSGMVVHGVKIEYERTHESYRTCENTEYETDASPRRYAKIIEIPAGATHIELRSALPDRYRHALHRL